VRYCIGCEKDRPLDRFRDRRRCIDCQNARIRERRRTNLALRERQLSAMRDYWESIKDERNAHRRATRDKAKQNAQRAARRRREPEVVQARDRRLQAERRARIAGAPFDEEARAFVPILMADPCSYCDDPATGVDHVQPLALGGDSGVLNITGSCPSCNTEKCAKPLLTFLLDRIAA
jgi:hypothetical protein